MHMLTTASPSSPQVRYETSTVGSGLACRCSPRCSPRRPPSSPQVRYETAESIKYLRPRPPVSGAESGARAEWAAKLVPGAAADYRYDGGWWEVELVRIEKKKRRVSFVGNEGGVAGGAAGSAAADGGASGGVTWLVREVNFEAEHEADLHDLRPAYNWVAGKDFLEGEWRERPPPELLFDKGTLRSVIEEQANVKKGRKAGTEIHPEGAPREKPNAYTVGTERRGVDGNMWEVVHRGSRDGNAAGLVEMWRPVTKQEPKWLQEERAKARAKAEAKLKGGFAAHELEDEEEDEEEEEVQQSRTGTSTIDIVPVMENELRLAGISAKKGYEELVYEAAVAIMGEAVVVRHTPAVQVSATHDCL